MSHDHDELTLINLINCYDFNLGELKARPTGMQYKTVSLYTISWKRFSGLDISFSRVKYNQIAPFVGLGPSLLLQDAPTFVMHCAHIPNALFRAIIEDIKIIMKQYGPPHQSQKWGKVQIFGSSKCLEIASQ